MAILDAIVISCLVIGVLFASLGVVGILRFPDVYTRLHAETKATTFGSIFTSLSVVIYAIANLIHTGDSQFLVLMIHVAIAVSVLAFTNATGAHAIARAAYRSGVLPTPSLVDQLAEAEKGATPHARPGTLETSEAPVEPDAEIATEEEKEERS